MNNKKYFHDKGDGQSGDGQSPDSVRELVIDVVFAACGLLVWAGFAAMILSHLWL